MPYGTKEHGQFFDAHHQERLESCLCIIENLSVGVIIVIAKGMK